MQAKRPRFEVADVVRAHGEEYRRKYGPSAAQEKVLTNIAQCRTAVLGGHLDECDDCGHQRPSYNSCCDRHCPKCQGPRRAKWLTERLERLLSTHYFHVVFTIPHELSRLALGNKKLIYGILFRAAAGALIELSADPRHLGGQIGLTAILHTWGQNLLLHPHLHCVVTGGGLSSDGTSWLATSEDYFLPVKALGRLLRGKFLHALQQAWRDGELRLEGRLEGLHDPVAWASFRDRLYQKEWVVYSKPPFGGPEHVFRYLGLYSHRVAISNHRILGLAGGKVLFSYKDYANGAAKKTMELDGVEFLRRFLLHVVPKGFVRIRHYGLCASSNVPTKLAKARQILSPTLAVPELSEPEEPLTWWERFLEMTGVDLMKCPVCGGHLIRRCVIPRYPTAEASFTWPRAPPVAA